MKKIITENFKQDIKELKKDGYNVPPAKRDYKYILVLGKDVLFTDNKRTFDNFEEEEQPKKKTHCKGDNLKRLNFIVMTLHPEAIGVKKWLMDVILKHPGCTTQEVNNFYLGVGKLPNLAKFANEFEELNLIRIEKIHKYSSKYYPNVFEIERIKSLFNEIL